MGQSDERVQKFQEYARQNFPYNYRKGGGEVGLIPGHGLYGVARNNNKTVTFEPNYMTGRDFDKKIRTSTPEDRQGYVEYGDDIDGVKALSQTDPKVAKAYKDGENEYLAWRDGRYKYSKEKGWHLPE